MNNNAYIFVRHFRKERCFQGDSLFFNKTEGSFALVNEGEFDELARQGWSDDQVGNTSPYKYDSLEDLNKDLRDIYNTEISMEDL